MSKSIFRAVIATALLVAPCASFAASLTPCQPAPPPLWKNGSFTPTQPAPPPLWKNGN